MTPSAPRGAIGSEVALERGMSSKAVAEKKVFRPSPLTIKQKMTPSPHSIGMEQSLSVAHEMMSTHELRHLPVLSGGKLVGLLSERDLYYLESVAGIDTTKERVEQGMSQDVYCASPEAKVEDVIREMTEHRYGCAVVVEGAKVVGIFTTTDALRLLADMLHGQSR